MSFSDYCICRNCGNSKVTRDHDVNDEGIEEVFEGPCLECGLYVSSYGRDFRDLEEVNDLRDDEDLKPLTELKIN